MIRILLLFGMACFLLPGTKGFGQSEPPAKLEAPRILTTRAEEDYSGLRNNDSLHFFLKDLKYISLSGEGTSYLTLGGEYRARMDRTENAGFGTEDETSYLQRINFHAALNFGQRVKVFAEFYHGYSSAGEVVLQSDDLDFHQAFIDWKLMNQDGKRLSLRLGRQELGYGSSRLVGIRNGPNMRRAFDMAKVSLQLKKAKMDAFYGSEVLVSPDAFDNNSVLIDPDVANPTLWGVYINRSISQNIRFLEFYYLGFASDFSVYNDVAGAETRHAFGLRSYGAFGRFTYNTELIGQVGEVGNSDVLAYNFETDWKYTLSKEGWKPQVGLKLDWSSGDQEAGDNEVGTFNPYFVNPGIYSLASVNTPANMTSLHPNVGLRPLEKLFVYVDYAVFFRTQTADGFYAPPRFLARPAGGSNERLLGQTIGLLVNYEFNRNIGFDVVTYYFITGEFLEETGEAENRAFIAPTLTFKF